MLKLGKRDPEFSDSDLRYQAMMKIPPSGIPFPTQWDSDATLPGLDNPMFLNDELGNCVIAGRAHQTRRFEYVEQGKIITITDDEVKQEYFSETGGEDSGLVVSRSLKRWRRRGWIAGGKNYKIQGYARLKEGRLYDIHSAIYADLGIGIGFMVPSSAMEQFDAGEPWDIVNPYGSVDGGHYVYVPAYTETSLVCVTWGKKQPMTNRFYNWYCDEAWAIFDAVNTERRKQLLDMSVLSDFISSLKP